MAYRDRQVSASQSAPSGQRSSNALPEALNSSSPGPLVTLAIELEQRVAALSAERDAAGRRIAELEAAAMHTAAWKSTVADQNSVLKQGLAAAQLRIDELEQQREHGRFEMQQMERENGHLNTRVTELQSKLDSVGQGSHTHSGQMPGEVAVQLEALLQDLAKAQARIAELEHSLEESHDEMQHMEHENASLNDLVAERKSTEPAVAAQSHHPSRKLVNKTAINQITDAVFNSVKQWGSEHSRHAGQTAWWFDNHCDRFKLVSATVAEILASGQGSGMNGAQLLSMALAQIVSATRKECKAMLSAMAELVGWAGLHPAPLCEAAQATARMFQDKQTQAKPYVSG